MAIYKQALRFFEAKKLVSISGRLSDIIRRPNKLIRSELGGSFPSEYLGHSVNMYAYPKRAFPFDLSKNYIVLPKSKDKPLLTLLHETGHIMDKEIKGPLSSDLTSVITREQRANINARKLINKYSKTPVEDTGEYVKKLESGYKTYTSVSPVQDVLKPYERHRQFLDRNIDAVRTKVEWEDLPIAMKSVRRNVEKSNRYLKQRIQKNFHRNKELI